MKILSFFWFFLRKYKKHMLIPLIFSLGLALQESLGPYLIKTIIDTIPISIQTSNWQPIYTLGVLYVLSVEVINILFRSRDYFKLTVFPKVKVSIVEYMYDKILNKNYPYHLNYHSGQLSNKIADLIKGVETIFNMIIDVFLWRTLSLLFASLTLYFAQPYFALMLFIWVLLFIYFSFLVSKNTHDLSAHFSESRNDLFGKISDGFSNILNIILYHSHDHEKKFIKRTLVRHSIKETNLLKKSFRIGLYQGIMVTIFIAIIMIGLIYSCKQEVITIGQFSLVIILSGTVVRNVYSISNDLVQCSKEFGACTEAMKILALDCEPLETKCTDKLVLKYGCIEYKNISYAYASDHKIFTNLNFSIHSKEKIGIVGISGVGKTTLISLLLRLFEPCQGSIFIDAQDITSVSLASLRSHIAVVPQEPVLFNRTLRENINFGSEKQSMENIIQAAKSAYCHDFICKLKNGYNTVVGERGVKLSGGEKQRIALARAFLKDAPIIIFDEPTSALDSLTERCIRKSLQQIIKTKTAIIIAHRLSTLKCLDKIYVFEEGKIIEQGTHAQLIENGSFYSQMFLSQNDLSKTKFLLDESIF